MIKRSAMQLMLLFVLALFVPASVLAQSTTSSGLNGRVVDQSGEPVANAQVTLVHVPSGTRSTATTSADGRFASRGLRVGGPYTVTVQRDGFRTTTQEDLYLLLAEIGQIQLQLLSDSVDLGRVEVVGAAISGTFYGENMGAGTNLTREQIESLPSIARSIQDYARLDPRISQLDKGRGEINALGQNFRYNNISIDGVGTNDPFGLEASGLPSLNNPISIDTIEEFNIGISSFDVTVAGATGASINAVTKSGTNEFSGSAYGFFRDNRMIRKNANGERFGGFDDEFTAGFTLGGPIIQDTLFFFLSYERFERSQPAPDVGILGSGASTIVPISQAEIDQIRQIAAGFGIDAGTFSPPGTITNKDDSILAKIDWNINDMHRLSARYNRTESSNLVLPRFGATSVSLSSHWYEQERKWENVVAQLYSDWSPSFSTELAVSYSEFNSVPRNFSRAPQIQVFPQVGQNRSVWLGTEQFRHANVLGVDTLKLFAAADWFLGDHTVKFGIEHTQEDIFNLFLQSSLGTYVFRSLDQFAAGTPTNYFFRTFTGSNVNDAAADWKLKTTGLFLQDTWQVNYNLTLMAGLRYDRPSTSDRPPFNQQFTNDFGFRNDGTVDGNGVFQPRFGFNYQFDTERRTQLRGGVGLFMGSQPNVWLSNPFTNNGLSSTDFSASDNNGLPFFSGNPDNQPRPDSVPPRQPVDVVDPNFKLPTVWKFNVAFEHELPWWGMVLGLEAIATEVENAIHYESLNIGSQTITMPDGRQGFWSSTNPNNHISGANTGNNSRFARARANDAFSDVILLRNTGKGNSFNLTYSLEKPMGENWYWKAAYTFGTAKETNPGTSSQAVSNWANNIILNPNEEVATTSNYALRDRFLGVLTYRNYFFENYQTTIGLLYEGRNGRPFSYTFIGDANGDGRAGNDLFYVPAGRNDVVFRDASQEEAFWRYIESNEYLNARRGEVVGRNDLTSPWVHQFDLRFTQEIPSFWRGRGVLQLDIQNVGNLLNKDWGRIEQVGFPFGRGVARYAGIDPETGRYQYEFPSTPLGATLADSSGESRWAVQLGVRYEF